MRVGTIYSIAGDNAGGAWVSIGGHGEFHYTHGVWQFVPVPGAEPDIAAVGTYVDDANRTWLLYDARKQVSVLEHGSARSLTEKDGLAVGFPHIIAGHENSLVVGGTQGIAYFDGKRFHTLYGGNGESFSDVFGIEPSPSGELWLSTVRGVIHIAANELANCMHAGCSNIPFELIDLNGDLPQPLEGAPAGSSHLPTSLRDANGQLWFATSSGIAVLDPKDFVQPDRPPPVIIRSATLDGKRYFGAVSVSLRGRVHETEIAYTAPNVSRPEDLRYRYRLTNWDTDWQYAGVRHEAI